MTRTVTLVLDDEWGINVRGTIPPGLRIEVRDYRLADDAEEGTTETDEDGRRYFRFSFGEASPS